MRSMLAAMKEELLVALKAEVKQAKDEILAGMLMLQSNQSCVELILTCIHPHSHQQDADRGLRHGQRFIIILDVCSANLVG